MLKCSVSLLEHEVCSLFSLPLLNPTAFRAKSFLSSWPKFHSKNGNECEHIYTGGDLVALLQTVNLSSLDVPAGTAHGASFPGFSFRNAKLNLCMRCISRSVPERLGTRLLRMRTLYCVVPFLVWFARSIGKRQKGRRGLGTARPTRASFDGL